MAPSGSVQGRAACRVGQGPDHHGQIDGVDESADKTAVDQGKNSVRSEHQYLESLTRTVIEMTQKSEVTNNETCNRAGIRMHDTDPSAESRCTMVPARLQILVRL